MAISAKLGTVHKERAFFLGISLALTLVVFAGFARTFYLREFLQGPPLQSSTILIHGVFFTSWMLLFLLQTFLISSSKVRLHRQLGYAGILLAVLVVSLGIAATLESARERPTTPEFDAVIFLISILTMLSFSVFFIAAVILRKDPASHKRLMVFATVALIAAAVARLPGVGALGPLAPPILADLFVVAVIVYDLITRRSVHKATVFGLVVFFICQVLAPPVATSQSFLSFKDWLILTG